MPGPGHPLAPESEPPPFVGGGRRQPRCTTAASACALPAAEEPAAAPAPAHGQQPGLAHLPLLRQGLPPRPPTFSGTSASTGERPYRVLSAAGLQPQPPPSDAHADAHASGPGGPPSAPGPPPSWGACPRPRPSRSGGRLTNTSLYVIPGGPFSFPALRSFSTPVPDAGSFSDGSGEIPPRPRALRGLSGPALLFK